MTKKVSVNFIDNYMIICYPKAKRHQQHELSPCKEVRACSRQSALFLPADLAVPCPKRPCGIVFLKRAFGLVPSIIVAELAIAELTPLPRRSLGGLVARAGLSAPRAALVTLRPEFSVSPASGLLDREIRGARHMHQSHA
jgi:hypothetical protein